MRNSPHTPRTETAARAGFTLLELLISVAIGAVVLAAMMHAARAVSDHVEEIRDEDDRSLEETLAGITAMVRQGWAVQADGAGPSITVTDAYGGRTVFDVAGGALQVTRPSGATGDLLDGVTGMSFTTETVQRLRDDTPRDVVGPAWLRPEPAGTAQSLVLEAGETLALAFMLDSDAPDAVDTVTGVEERLLEATLETLTLPVGFVDGDNKEFCHLYEEPPHNPSHPDYEGGILRLELYEARSPGDARPDGPLLAALDLGAGALAPTPHIWHDITKAGVTPPDAPGGELIPHEVFPEDVPGGVAWGWWKNHPEIQLALTTPAALTTLDISSWGLTVEPGRAYTLLLKVYGHDMLVLRLVPTSPDPSLAIQSAGGTTWTPQSLGVAASLGGTNRYTQTSEHFPVSGLTLTVTMADGRSATSSAVVAGQVASPNPWLGAIPGEVPTLEASGQ